MDPDAVRSSLVEVLEGIQADSDYAPTPINGSTCPLSDLGGFDSKTWPVAVTQLSQATGIAIPPRKNIFVAADGKRRLTVDEIVDGVCRLAAAPAAAA